MKKTYLFTGIIFAAILFASLIWWKKPSYEYIHPRRGEITEAIYGLGKVKARRKYDVKVAVNTHVRNVFVKEGQNVKKGDPLIQFDDSGIFRAPYDGTVTNISFNIYDSVVPQATALTLQDMSDKYLEVSLEQEGALRVKKGQRAIILFESLRGDNFQGVVDAIFPKQDEFLAHIEVNGLEKNVLPGMTADASIIVSEHKESLLIPVSSLSNGQVIVRRPNGKKQKISVKIGGVDGEWAEVLGGEISETDEVQLKIKKSANP